VIPDLQDIQDVAYQMMWVTLLLSMPTLLTALVVGVFISLIQAITQVQEMTLTFVPKLFLVLLVMAGTMPWMIELMMNYTEDIMALFSSRLPH
jgi:flagellar biosynthetic protein FliQ